MLENKNPRISVVMPNYNAEKYIAEAIESILNQSFSDFEFIIIDDGSSDKSWKIIQEYTKKDKRIVAIKNEKNLKICKTLNKWIELARWEYIARMDSDDISHPERLEKQVKFLDKNLEVGIVGANIDMIDEDWKVYSKRKYHFNDSEIRKYIFRYSPFCHPVVMIRKSILEKSRNYDPDLVYAEDYDLYFRIWMYSKFANLNESLIKYRMFENNSTTKKLKQMEKCTLFIRKKAEKKYGYKMTLLDRIYYYLQCISMFIIPRKLKIWLFNLLRNS